MLAEFVEPENNISRTRKKLISNKVLTNISLTQKIIATFALHKICNTKHGIDIKRYGTAE